MAVNGSCGIIEGSKVVILPDRNAVQDNHKDQSKTVKVPFMPPAFSDAFHVISYSPSTSSSSSGLSPHTGTSVTKRERTEQRVPSGKIKFRKKSS